MQRIVVELRDGEWRFVKVNSAAANNTAITSVTAAALFR